VRGEDLQAKKKESKGSKKKRKEEEKRMRCFKEVGQHYQVAESKNWKPKHDRRTRPGRGRLEKAN